MFEQKSSMKICTILFPFLLFLVPLRAGIAFAGYMMTPDGQLFVLQGEKEKASGLDLLKVCGAKRFSVKTETEP